MIPCSYRASTCIAALPPCSAFMISVRQARDLPPASSGSHLAMGTLALGYILPATGRIRDLHPLERAPAGRTMKKMRPKIGAFYRGMCRIYRFVPCSFLSVQNCYCRRRTRPDPASVTVPFCIAILPFTMTRSMPDGASNGCR